MHAPKIFFIHGMGHCGSGWFKRCCGLHPEIELWTEKIQSTLKLHKLRAVKSEVEWHNLSIANNRKTFGFLKQRYKECKKQSFGILKVNPTDIIPWCGSLGGQIVRLIRNPIAFVAYTMYRYFYNFDFSETPQMIFKKHLIEMAAVTMDFLKDRHKYKLIRLEDMNNWIYSDPECLRKMMEQLTGVAWSHELIEKIKFFYKDCGRCNGTGISKSQQMICSKCRSTGRYKEDGKIVKCNMCEGRGVVWSEDDNCFNCGGKDCRRNNSYHKKIWLIWADWQKEMFKKFFDPIMEELNYGYK